MFTKLANPSILPGALYDNAGKSISISSNGKYVARIQDVGNRITVYKGNLTSLAANKCTNSMSEVYEPNNLGLGYAKESGNNGDVKQVVRLWRE